MGVYIKGMTLDEAEWLLGPTRENEIIEIKSPHGRLIDAEDLLEGTLDHDLISTHIIYNSPTVIEAEVE